MAEVYSEQWRPPLFAKPSDSLVAKFAAGLRRFLDLQAGSVWRDLAAVLPQVRGRVLDVGCGAQPYRPLVHPEATYVAIDTDEAKSHFGYEMPNTVYFSGDRWPIEDDSVDFVLCTETMEHVFDTKRFLSEAQRCLKQEGTMLLTVPFAARWHFIPHDYWRFTPSCMKFLLRRSGFADVRVYARGNAGTVACYKAMALILPLLAAEGATPLKAFFMRIAGILLSPLLCILAVIANLTLLGRGGNDCLGYTVTARRSNILGEKGSPETA